MPNKKPLREVPKSAKPSRQRRASATVSKRERPQRSFGNNNKIINLALQGGGAHGAYTWGVLDRLLEDERISIEGISGTSAGAMNGAILVNGFAKGGYKGAREALEKFWSRVSEMGSFSPVQQTPLDRAFNGWNLDASPVYTAYDIAARIFSPYQANPLNYNPLRQVMEEMIDFETLNNHKGIKLFITATSVRTGQERVFHCSEVTIETLLASTCLPTLFQAVEIDGEAYWDGGYSGNPAIWPLIYNCDSNDIMLVQINPFVREEVPVKANEIVDRMNEISFNSSLIAEFRAIKFVSKLMKKGMLKDENYRDLRTHIVFSPEELHDLNASSKMNANWDFFIWLRDIGRTAMDVWLKKNFDKLGHESTFHFDDVLKLKKKPASA